jgi:predicted ester cyclase
MLQTLETWTRRVWVERDETAIDELRMPDAHSHGLDEQALTDNEAFKSFHRRLCALLSDTELVIDHHLEADGWLAARCTFRGTAADGRRVAMNGMIHVRIADGRIREAHNQFDFIGLFVRMGLLPPDTFQCCMAGAPGRCRPTERHLIVQAAPPSQPA